MVNQTLQRVTSPVLAASLFLHNVDRHLFNDSDDISSRFKDHANIHLLNALYALCGIAEKLSFTSALERPVCFACRTPQEPFGKPTLYETE
jgi:hypothetical protein